MGAIVLPSDYGELGKNLASLTQTIGQVVNPFHDLQMHMRNAVAADPDLAQKLADMEDATPGILEHLGLGSVGKEIARIPPSQAQIIKKATKDRLKAQAEGTGGDEYIQKTLTGQNTAQQKVDLAEAEFKKAEADAENLRNVPLAAHNAVMADLKPEIDKLPDTDMYKAAEDFDDHKLDARTSAAIANSPAYAAQFERALVEIRSQRANKLQLSKEQRQNDNGIRSASGNAALRYGLDPNVLFHLYKGDDPALFEKLRAIQDNPKSAKPGDEPLVRIAEFLKDQTNRQEISAISNATVGLKDLFKNIDSLSGDALAGRVTDINFKLQALNHYSGTNYKMAIDDGKATLYEDGKPVKNQSETLDKIEVETGKRIIHNTSDQGGTAAPNNRPNLSPNQNAALDDINKGTSKSEKQARYNKFKTLSPMSLEAKQAVGTAAGVEP